MSAPHSLSELRHERVELPSGSLRILFDTPDQRLRGGPPTHLPLLESELRRFVEVHLYQYGRKSDTENLPEKVFGRAVDLIRVRSACRALRPDLIHHNSAFDRLAIFRDALLVLMANHQRIPIFIKIHGSMPEAFSTGPGLLELARKIVLRRGDGFGVLSSIEKGEFEAAFPCVRGKVWVVKNIVDADFFKVPRCEANRPQILFLSRFIRRKGLFDLLHAVPLVLKEVAAAEFLFIGDGEDATTFEREVSAMQCPSIKLLKHTSDRDAVFSSAWMLALPTLFPEGMPMVIAESMAAGLPVVSTPTRFSRSYLTEGQHALYCQPGDVEGIAKSIIRLCKDKTLRERMSQANRRMMSEKFTAEHVTKEFLEIYGRLVEG